ncbi:hypothetical protein [Methanobrevibacter curvatus]|uniref:Uncharacterized protein n=1 Tax=Methanobrevibacter curvatus TaxID=49547 RepID=A0A166C1M3_9EURY|nr:hypothetical protein [Methanobrevibacter curvatus]KZX14038.1 hypothetical protein MBCUR_06560 [Methanobrevibacter curvatus]
MSQSDLSKYNTNCPVCGKKTIQIRIGRAKLAICSDILHCDYHSIDDINSIVINPSAERLEKEKEWYEDRYANYKIKEKEEQKRKFIAQEMKKLKERELKK